jgi:hypothetical protein
VGQQSPGGAGDRFSSPALVRRQDSKCLYLKRGAWPGLGAEDERSVGFADNVPPTYHKGMPSLSFGDGSQMAQNQLRRLIAVCFLALLPVSGFADEFFWGCGYGDPQILRSGQVACRQEVRKCKKMILSCSLGSKALFTVHDFADYIAASDDGRYIVGLSNHGSENAFWIRDSHGKVIERKKHLFQIVGTNNSLGIHYCTATVTNVRVWFDWKQPDVRFRFKDGKLVQVAVRGCDGNDLQLLK